VPRPHLPAICLPVQPYSGTAGWPIDSFQVAPFPSGAKIKLSMRSFFRIVLMILVLLSVALVSALTAMRFAIHGREVAVPKFVGLTPSQALAVAQGNGLLMAIDGRYYSADVPPGKVMSQSPAPGAKVRRGWHVRLAESLGPQRVEIPDVQGQSIRAAEINLGRRGLEAGAVVTARLLGLPTDQVVGQDPPPNAGNVTSPKVNLLVTAPSEISGAYLMPDFSGKTLAEAKITVEDAGFRMGPVALASAAPAGNTGPSASAERLGNPTSPKDFALKPNGKPQRPAESDIIVRQTPAARQKIVAGATVSFQVAKP
jgi:eukaryotic-like serine/threonine-protein kinase